MDLRCVRCRLESCSQVPKICGPLQSGHMLNVTWMIDHVVRVNLYRKKNCLIVPSLWEKQHCVLLGWLRFARLSLVRITPLRRYQRNILVFRGCHFIKYAYCWMAYHSGLKLDTYSELRGVLGEDSKRIHRSLVIIGQLRATLERCSMSQV